MKHTQLAAAAEIFRMVTSEYKRFDALKADLKNSARFACVLDGEIVCLDGDGRPQFYDLLRRRGDPVFVAFDILSRNGRDLRNHTLVARKRILHDTVRPKGQVLCPGFIDTNGTALYERACQLDLEGIVAKAKRSPYTWQAMPSHRDVARVSPWLKIRNPNYTEMIGRAELFERRAK